MIAFVVIICSQKNYAQSFLNGNFELNNASIGIDQIALTNTQFNTMVSDITSFGSSSTGLDLITTSIWDGPPFDGNWYLGIEGGGIEQFSMELSSPLIIGTTYRISFFDRGRSVHPPAPIEIGISLVNNSFGTLIYTGPQPEFGVWNLRCFTFVASVNATYITVKGGNSIGSWTKLDSFVIDTSMQCSFTGDVSMPNVFTPNGDGINDFFVPIKFENIDYAHLQIMNRWGKLIFETEDVLNGWNGDGSSDGTYYWLIRYRDAVNDEKTIYGFLNLFR